MTKFLFSAALQPGTVSLFSSTGSNPLFLFSQDTDKALPSDSFIHLLNDESSEPLPAEPAKLIQLPVISTSEDAGQGLTLVQSVLHIQSPTLRTTFIRVPARGSDQILGLKHPWLHIQVRNLGREWSFEVGIVDHAGREGILRLSTFQKQPELKHIHSANKSPLLHLPLSFPPSSSRPLTAWSIINLNLPALLLHFTSLALSAHSPDMSRNINSRRLPNGTYSHVSFVKVYATCRLRRIWFSESGPGQKLPWEFELYGGAND
ncbi:transcription factor iib [Moniliophthora roreri MCA 2997]|uniref:Transcription factor iib n=1 Tax=Moniliophthora roreri (strain MCA 2997) TaxID=1381753 RepID=V2WXR2_MONRO|nr:transcription factor iib [Moniliophthora roreri MCA 2997]